MPTESLPRRNTDPVWLQDFFVANGHSEDTPNATGTFISRYGRIYLLTCAHVVEELANIENAPYPTIALHSDDVVMNFSVHTISGHQLRLRVPEALDDSAEVDIAIASVSSEEWELLQREKDKVAIDLDHWREPDWSKVRMGLAAGYPNEHKRPVMIANEERIGTPRIDVVAQFRECIANMYVIHSALEAPHGTWLSGISGGPLYAVENDDGEPSDESLRFVGIICQGGPRSSADPGDVPLNQLLVAAIPLTPEIFDRWLVTTGS